MPSHPRPARSGRLLDWLVLSLLALVFAGLTAYHWQRREHDLENEDRIRELSKQQFAEDRTPRFDWPQWRGPNRDGVSTETDLIADWPKDGPRLLWEKPVGEGYASVAVVKDRLFTIFQENGREHVVCWDAEKGKEIWRFGYPCEYKNSYGNGSRATPTLDGDFVYTVGATGLMHCLKAFTDNPQGELVWKKDLLREFEAPLPGWGVSFSPLVEGERVFIQPGGPNGNSLAALDKSTGTVLWKGFDDVPSYSSPIAATFQGQRQILFFTGSRLVGVAPDTGTFLWEHGWVTDFQCNIATPIIVQDYVFLSSGYGRGFALLKIDKAGANWEAALVYKNSRMRNHFATCVRYKDYLYGFDDSIFTCMNFRTGKMQWQERGFDKGCVLLANNQLIVYGENGVLALVEPDAAAYREKARFQFSGQHGSCWSVPVVANGRLYVRDAKKLACFDVKAAK